MKATEKAKLFDVLIGAAAIGPLHLREIHGDGDDKAPTSLAVEARTESGTHCAASFWLADGKPLSCMGDRMIAVVKKSFPGIEVMSDAEREETGKRIDARRKTE